MRSWGGRLRRRSRLVRLSAAFLVLVLAPWPAAQGDPAPATFATAELVCEDSAFWDDRMPGHIPAMETSWIPLSEGTPVLPEGRRGCAAHLGHHTYSVGSDRVLRLENLTGFALLVEQNVFSPAAGTPEARIGERSSIYTRMPVEASLDGVTWETVTMGIHDLVSLDTTPTPGLPLLWKNFCDNSGTCVYRDGTAACLSIPQTGCSGNNHRQLVRFAFDGEGPAFRYLRVRAPESIYTGLTGFLDWSQFTLGVEDLGPAVVPEAVARTGVAFSCATDVLEDIHSRDPCTFGGYLQEETNTSFVIPAVRVGNVPGQWDAPSFFHTYPLGNATLTRIAGEVVARDWRTNGVSVSHGVELQASSDGQAWESLGFIPLTKRSQTALTPENETDTWDATFELTANNTTVRFLRLVADPLPTAFWSESTPWANRHPWAYLKESRLELDGLLPAV